MNLYQKLVELQKCAASFEKDSKGYGYTYVSGAQVLNAIKKKKDELGLLLVPAVQNPQEVSKHEYKNEKGREKVDFVVRGEMVYKWINAEKPEEALVVPWQYFGQQDDISKAFGSALTYSERYFLLKFLGVPTDEDDPDAKESKPKEKTYQAERTYDKPQEKPKYEATPKYEEKPKYEATENKPSKFGRLKELAAKEGKTMNDAIALSEKMFGTNMINSLTETQFLEVVSALRTKKELPLGKPIQIDDDLPF